MTLSSAGFIGPVEPTTKHFQGPRMVAHHRDQRLSEHLPVAPLVLAASNRVPSSARESHVALARDELLLLWRSKWHRWKRAENYSFDSIEQYMAFCAAIDWLQETVEALSFYLSCGLSAEATDAHLEVRSLLQAVWLQQHAISELEYALVGHRKPLSEYPTSWIEIRTLRSPAAGSRRRKAANGQTVRYCLEDPRVTLAIRERENTGPKIDLGRLISDYDRDAGMMIRSSATKLSQRLE
jgi:hypothetical protein